MNKKKWIVDPCREGGGGWTVRVDNGSDCGDINQDPIATFNDRDDADRCVLAHNAHNDLVAALDGLLATFYDGGEGGPEATLRRQMEAAHAAQKVLDKIKGSE